MIIPIFFRTMCTCLVVSVLCASGAQAQEKSSPWRGNFERYHPNYVAGGFNFDAQVKFQVSIKYRVFTNYPMYFAYSQKSFWDLYDWENSTPFRESNYNPELFYRISSTSKGFLRYIQAGVEHESNGRSGIESRSWNRITFASRVTILEKYVYVEPRFWIPFAIASENKDIRTYLGFGHVTAMFFIFPDPDNNRLEITVRPGIDNGMKGVSFRINAMIRPLTSLGFDLFGINPYMLLQLWHGYGENLIEYNVRSTRFRIGFTF